MEYVPFTDLLSNIVDNRGKTCPVADEGLPLIATNCVKNDTLYPVFEKVRFVSDNTYTNWFRGHPEPGDLILVTKGSPGNVCMTPDPVSFCIAQDMVAICADKEKIDPLYLFAVLRSPQVQFSIGNMHVGTLIPHFKKGDFDKLKLPVPDRDTQEYIGKAYFDFCNKIELNQRMNETLEGMARALFKSWFVDFDPVHAKASGQPPAGMDAETAALFPSAFSDDGMPEGWEQTTLDKVAALNPESWGNANHPDDVEYVDLANTKWGTIESTQNFSWSDAPSRARRVLKPGDTIVGTVRPGNGSYSFVGIDGLTGSTGFAVLRPKQEIYREAVCYAATSKDNIDRLAHLADGGAYPAVRPDVVMSTPFVSPGDEVLEAFSRYTADMLDKIEANKQENITLTNLRDTLLPKLISGELRVNEADNQIREAV